MPLSDETMIEEAREAFARAADAEAENRREALDDLRFARLGEQWPERIRRERDLEGRPCLTINRLPAFIRQVVNDARQNKPAIVVHPVDDGADPQTAEVFNGLIRHIEQSSDAEVAYDTALDFAVTSGVGYFRINTRYATDDGFEQDLAIERVANPFGIYGDPDSTAADSSDWNTAFVVDSVPKAAFAARWKGADPVDWQADAYGAESAAWMAGDRVTVAEYWRREQVERTILALSDGQVVEEAVYAAQKAMFDALGVKPVGRPRTVASHRVRQRIVTGAQVLETVDWAGKFIPIAMKIPPPMTLQIPISHARSKRCLDSAAVAIFAETSWFPGLAHAMCLPEHRGQPPRRASKARGVAGRAPGPGRLPGAFHRRRATREDEAWPQDAGV